MLRSTARLNSTAPTASIRSPRTSTISAASMAMSVPAPMAIPTSAVAKAGASLMPSPIMATLPRVFSSSTIRALSWGRIPAWTSAIPSSAPMAWAVVGLSPVSITVRMPRARKASRAALEVGFTTSAQAISPSNTPSSAT